MRKLGVVATNRASFYLYTTPRRSTGSSPACTARGKCSREPSSTSCTERSSSTTTRTRASHGLLEAPDAQAEGQNPLCGDEVAVSVRFDGDTIADVGFEGRGCAISQAATSMLTEIVVGRNAPRRSRGCRRRSCSRRSASRSRRSG